MFFAYQNENTHTHTHTHMKYEYKFLTVTWLERSSQPSSVWRYLNSRTVFVLYSFEWAVINIVMPHVVQCTLKSASQWGVAIDMMSFFTHWPLLSAVVWGSLLTSQIIIKNKIHIVYWPCCLNKCDPLWENPAKVILFCDVLFSSFIW